jgi:asparagine synthase (glutamine-hydrolysing)
MCGICGVLDRRRLDRIDRDILSSMTAAIVHRGPDDAGYLIDRNVGLGFRRLSIVDLSGGNQPLYNEDRSVAVVCNGEIYNFPELRRLLEGRGHKFQTRSDVEVLVHLYEEYGEDFVRELNGQFAFCLVDLRNHKSILGRDHTGVAPLFYCEVDGLFLFGSEIKAILKHPTVIREVNLTALDQIVTFPGMVSPQTMFKGIYSLPAGHQTVIAQDRLVTRPYWDLNYPLAAEIEAPRDEEYYIERLDHLITQSVQRRLQADVPVGFYISGGLDSSLIASYLHRLQPNNSFHSFSIGFNDAVIDERKFQQIMVNQVNSKHAMTLFGWEEIATRLRQVIFHSECPIKESYDTCTMALAELVRRSGLKVAMTGEGSDEMFAGYVGYRMDREGGFGEEDLSDLEIAMEKELRDSLWGDENFFYEKNYLLYTDQKQALYSARLADTLSDFDAARQPLIDTSKTRGRHPIHQRSYIDFKLRIADHLLSDHADRMSFASSVEGRFPFLDKDLIEFVTTIPPQLLVKSGVEKYLLKRLGERRLPREITNREKFAFVAPGSPFLLRQETDWLNDLLSYETIKRQGYFNPETIESLKRQYSVEGFRLNQTFEADLMMIVITFGLFLELFDMPAA